MSDENGNEFAPVANVVILLCCVLAAIIAGVIEFVKLF